MCWTLSKSLMFRLMPSKTTQKSWSALNASFLIGPSMKNKARVQVFYQHPFLMQLANQNRACFSGEGLKGTVPELACFYSVGTVVLQHGRADMDQCFFWLLWAIRWPVFDFHVHMCPNKLKLRGKAPGFRRNAHNEPGVMSPAHISVETQKLAFGKQQKEKHQCL